MGPKQALSQSVHADNDQTNVIRGTVVNSVTHEPIGRALVFSSDNQFATMTDGQGRFEIILPRAKTERNADSESSNAASTAVESQDEIASVNRPQNLTARKPGFLMDNNEEQQNQLETPGRDITLSLMPEARIIGHIVLPSSEAAFAIRAELYRKEIREGSAHWVLAGAFLTNAFVTTSGEFRFAELAPGTYKLLTREALDRGPETFVPGDQQYGYPPSYYPGAPDFAAASPIELSAGQTFQADFSLERLPYYAVKVHVSNAPIGVPMEISVSTHGHKSPGYSLSYNPADQVIEGSLPNGDYALEAASYGANATTGAMSITIKGAPLEESSMVLVSNRSIGVNVKEEFTVKDDASSGAITRGRENPRRTRQVNVVLEPVDDFGVERAASLRPPARLDDDPLVIENVQPGHYWVRVTAFRGFASSVRLNGINLLQEALVVGPDGLSSPIEVILRNDSAQIEGKVEGPRAEYSGKAGPGSPPFAYVYCVPLSDSNGLFTQVWVSPNGEFSSPEMPPGAYRVFAFNRPQQELEYRNAQAMGLLETKGQVVHLVPGQKEHLQLRLISNE